MGYSNGKAKFNWTFSVCMELKHLSYSKNKNNSGLSGNSAYRVILDGRNLGKQSIIETVKTSSGFQTLRELQTARPNFFTTIDFTMSFHHIAYGNQESKESISFTVHCYQFLVYFCYAKVAYTMNIPI